MSYIGDNPCWSFLVDQIYQRVQDRFEYDRTLGRKSLRELPGFEDLIEISHDLIGVLESLPWSYSLFVQLNKTVSDALRPAVTKNASTYVFDDAFSLVVASSELTDAFPLPAPGDFSLGILSQDFLKHRPHASWSEDALYLRCEHVGFVGRLGLSRPSKQALADIKAFGGLGIACFLLNPRRGSAPS
ncbi:MAG TPA: hypothetical protein VFY87_07335, partial [Geminicoccaceae bacterium]|nr:hypothetical protein [Geminicoccaceae bacterium]